MAVRKAGEHSFRVKKIVIRLTAQMPDAQNEKSISRAIVIQSLCFYRLPLT
jgi:hypothetical protein